ncbi:MAG: AAA-like domain-containing protein [Tolypothrix carrinoi HA7290-LM1]|nr:AAA-like domain-containing protein [Tolypothrix carrinoi HA7290-LM1]
MKKILILTANPKNTDRLRLDEELREIQAGLERAKKREQFEIITRWAVRPDDLRRTLLDCDPQIVHFSGHGSGNQGLALENDTGQAKLISAESLSRLFKLFKGIECVLLNACYSKVQAEAIHQHIDYVIGMSQAIGDKAAREFAIGFYDGLGAGRSIEDAYEFGCNAIELEGIPESEIPVLKINQRLIADKKTPKSVFISYRTQEPDRNLAQQFYEALTSAGHQAFMAAESIRLGENWVQRIDAELRRCDYFLLLLSPQSVVSEMVIEEVKRARELRDTHPEQKPIILPIRVNFSLDLPLNYELRGYLNQIQQREWHSSEDTPVIIEEILRIVASGTTPPKLENAELAVNTICICPQDNPDRPPLPVAEPELNREPGGTVPLRSGLYVERFPIETDCFAEIIQPGALIRIKAPRQMGKTSLMARILNYASEQGYQTIPISLQRADNRLFTNLDYLLRWLCQQVGRRLERLHRLEDYWQDHDGNDRCTYYFEECLLTEIDTPLVLGLDEVDRVFPHREIADDFFGLVRSWYESARYGDFSSELWEKLRLVVVHSTEVYIPLNINQSPFNVGKNVELPEFIPAQVQDLAQRYGLLLSELQLQQLLAVLGGHPYLIRKAFYHLRKQDLTWEQLLQTAPTEAGIYSDHLRRHLLNLQQYPALAEALRQIAFKGKPLELGNEATFKLDSMGLIKLQGNEAIPRCDMYRDYFRIHLKN